LFSNSTNDDTDDNNNKLVNATDKRQWHQQLYRY